MSATRTFPDLPPDLCALVADESAYARRVLREMLARAGLRRVREAADGAAALDILSGGEPDLLVVDWDLAVLSGAEFVRLARRAASSPRPTVPIILTLAEPRRSTVARAVSLGVDEILAKPFAPRALWERLDAVINRPHAYARSGSLLRPQRPEPARVPEAA